MRTLVTGGTRGIGAAVARRLAADGHDLVLGYARDDDAASLTEAACLELGVDSAAVAWLLSDDASYVTGTTLRVAGGR